MRHNLYMFRCNNKLTQAEMADRTGVCRATYANIESGKRGGSIYFWNKLQSVFNVPDADMWRLQKIEEGAGE